MAAGDLTITYVDPSGVVQPPLVTNRLQVNFNNEGLFFFDGVATNFFQPWNTIRRITSDQPFNNLFTT